jgi:hypothetical protein
LKLQTVYAIHVVTLSVALAFVLYLQAGRPGGLSALTDPRQAANLASALRILFYISANAAIVLLAPFIARFGIKEVDSARIKRELSWLRLTGFNLLFGSIWVALLLIQLPAPSWMNPGLFHFALTLHIAVLMQVMIHVNICKIRSK